MKIPKISNKEGVFRPSEEEFKKWEEEVENARRIRQENRKKEEEKRKSDELSEISESGKFHEKPPNKPAGDEATGDEHDQLQDPNGYICPDQFDRLLDTIAYIANLDKHDDLRKLFNIF